MVTWVERIASEESNRWPFSLTSHWRKIILILNSCGVYNLLSSFATFGFHVSLHINSTAQFSIFALFQLLHRSTVAFPWSPHAISKGREGQASEGHLSVTVLGDTLPSPALHLSTQQLSIPVLLHGPESGAYFASLLFMTLFKENRYLPAIGKISLDKCIVQIIVKKWTSDKTLCPSMMCQQSCNCLWLLIPFHLTYICFI